MLLNLYRTIIRSKLYYGSIIYGSARKSYLEMLDPIHHQGLRLALGAFRTSPSESLLAEANEPSLYNRRLKLSMQYALKLKSNPSNPTYETVFEPQYKTLFENKPNMIPSFGIRISSEFENINLDLDNIWLVGCFGLSSPLRQYFSLYRAVSQREGERGEKG